MSDQAHHIPNDLDAYWMPFTANRQFKDKPRMVVGADGMYYKLADGRDLMDGIAGLWCCNAGHNRPRITRAIRDQAGLLDYSPAFQMGHAKAFELAARLARMMPGDLNHIFFTNSGSESVETALKMALAYHRLNGEGHRTRLIGRAKGYHGVNFGGMSVGGMTANRKMFGSLVAGVDHLPHTHGIEANLFTRGQPEHGAWLADDLEELCALHDPSTIAAVIVEPLAGSAGVILPPKGYLERLREICDKHGILLIFDEVITAYGRLGQPFATSYFGVQPDIVTTAKALANGVIPAGAVFVRDHIHDAFMTGPDHVPEFFHGYTFSGNPMACAAALATLDTYEEEGLLTRGTDLWDYWEDAVHSLADCPHVIDLRNMGLIAGIEMRPGPRGPGTRAFDAFLAAYEKGLLIRTTGDTIALSPPLIIEKHHIDFAFDTVRAVLKEIE
ncbi:aspartate aminotransferase family protein [Yunchengibacter salinarum]|uniref:aspartate aminotransferase family protein n=1 Tax=Yunchengibacter salinarum TaxID=3133399 RepID=UPI0035B5EEB6